MAFHHFYLSSQLSAIFDDIFKVSYYSPYVYVQANILEKKSCKVALFLTRQSLGEFLFLLFRFFFLSSFCLLVLLSTFYLDQTFPKSFQLGLAWLSLTQLDST